MEHRYKGKYIYVFNVTTLKIKLHFLLTVFVITF